MATGVRAPRLPSELGSAKASPDPSIELPDGPEGQGSRRTPVVRPLRAQGSGPQLGISSSELLLLGSRAQLRSLAR